MTMDITFTDYFRLTKPNEEQVNEWKDYMGGMTSGINRGLRVIMEATHAGLLNRNKRFYIPSRMAEGVATFRTGEKPTKMMKHHNPESDPVGVIRGARFVPTIPDDLVDNPDVQNLMSSSAPIKTQLKSIRNLWKAGVFNRDGWRGLGYIELIGDVYDQETINQINDGRFDAVSTNFRSPGAAHCLICGKNWATDGFCEHEWGELYSENEDDEDSFKFPAMPIPGVHEYLETSFIAFEGDALANVRVMDKSNEDNNKTIFLPDNFKWDESFDSTEPKFEFKDFEEDKMAKPAKGNKITFSDAEQKVFDTIKKLRQDVEDKVLADFAKKISAMYDENGSLPDQEEAEIDGETAVRYALEDLETKDQKIDDAKIQEIEMFYQEEFEKMHAEELLTDEQFEEAKASTEKRKSLPKTSFCGPDGAFPVPDSMHLIAAKRFIDRYVGPGSKTNILATINRKAKAIGCSDSEQNIEPNTEDPKINLLAHDEDSLKEMDVKDLRNLHMATEVELISRGQKMAYECKECALHEEKVQKATQEVADMQAKTKKLEDTLSILREEFARLQVEFMGQVDHSVELGAAIFAEQVEKFALIGVLAGKYDNLDNAKEVIQASNLKTIEASFADFDVTVAATKLNDGMANTPSGTVEDPTINTDGDNKQLPEGLSGPAVEAVENIRELCSTGQIRDAKHIYATMKSMKLFPDELTFESLSAATEETVE